MMGNALCANPVSMLRAGNDATEATKKINEDFEGAKGAIGKILDEWTFVHNAP